MAMNPAIPLIAVLAVSTVFGRTIRYQIVTKDDGTKEILSSQIGAPSKDLKILAQDLNASVAQSASSTESPADIGPIEALTLTTEEKDTVSDVPLLNKLNSYTSNGWTGQKNAVYANSTKLTIFDDGAEVHQVHSDLIKKGRAENITDQTSIVEVPIDEPGLWEVIERIYDCFSSKDTKLGGTIECLRLRMTSMFYKFLDQSLNNSSGKSQNLKSFTHGKKVLKGALLPLLVLLVIKYLVALPVIAAGLVTIKTFWLSLLSAGVAAFGTPWKHHHHTIKRYRPEIDQVWPQPPWTYALHSSEAISKAGTVAGPPVTDKYFM